jgi:23S rRNA (uracil1939-C5)-methyltransferase
MMNRKKMSHADKVNRADKVSKTDKVTKADKESKVNTKGKVNTIDKKSKVEVPVKKNDEIELILHGLTHEGMGVGKYQGFTIFVKHALPNETIRAKVILIKRNYAVAKLIELMKESEQRQVPPCMIYKQCGGCQLQHLTYEAQLAYKEQLVKDNLQRIGGIELHEVNLHAIIGMDEPWRYRNKAQIPIGEEDGGLIGGFYKENTHQIINMDECLIQHEPNDQLLREVKHIAHRLGIPAYQEENHQGLLRHVVAKYGRATGELMLVLITNGADIPHQEALIEALRASIPQLKSIVQNINTEQTNVIFGSKTKLLWGSEYIYDHIGDICFAISARSFYQVNPVQTKILYDKALEYAQLTGNETVIDAYCGVGTISLFLARKAKQVLGVEIVPEAIADAKRNAQLNQIENVTFAVGEAEKIMPWWQAQGIRADVIVVDPPRKGCDSRLIETMLQMKPERIVYVSCNPSTLARDVKLLGEGGYKLEKVQPVDMFPHTAHVECVVLMSRVEK